MLTSVSVEDFMKAFERLQRRRLSPHLRSAWVEKQGPHTPLRNIYLSSWLDGLNDHPTEKEEGEDEEGKGKVGEGKVKRWREFAGLDGSTRKKSREALSSSKQKNNKNDLASHIYHKLWKIWLWHCLLLPVGGLKHAKPHFVRTCNYKCTCTLNDIEKHS